MYRGRDSTGKSVDKARRRERSPQTRSSSSPPRNSSHTYGLSHAKRSQSEAPPEGLPARSDAATKSSGAALAPPKPKHVSASSPAAAPATPMEQSAAATAGTSKAAGIASSEKVPAVRLQEKQTVTGSGSSELLAAAAATAPEAPTAAATSRQQAYVMLPAQAAAPDGQQEAHTGFGSSRSKLAARPTKRRTETLSAAGMEALAIVAREVPSTAAALIEAGLLSATDATIAQVLLDKHVESALTACKTAAGPTKRFDVKRCITAEGYPLCLLNHRSGVTLQNTAKVAQHLAGCFAQCTTDQAEACMQTVLQHLRSQ